MGDKASKISAEAIPATLRVVLMLINCKEWKLYDYTKKMVIGGLVVLLPLRYADADGSYLTI